MSDWRAVASPLGPFADGFWQELARLGYKPRAAGAQMRLLADLSGWLEVAGVSSSALTVEVVGEFLKERRCESSARFRTPMGMATLLDYLRAIGVVPQAARRAPIGPTDELLERYYRFLVDHRGLTDAVVAQHEIGARLFMDYVDGINVGLPEVTAGDVSTFVTKHCAHPVKLRPIELTSILRSFLRFLSVEGLTTLPLAQAVPPIASWSASSLPKALPRGQVTLLLHSCDRRTSLGRRDFAILSLLARLGLRAKEIVALGLDDFDWRAGEVVIHGKGRRDECLPLPADAGEAVVAYLCRGRPTSDCRAVFLRSIAPLRALTRSAITQIVGAACDRAGVPRVGAHRLRHTLATELLRSGASLVEVGQVLRHRSISTTSVYAKVDHDALTALARPWPGGAA